jgi:hypothetical protein
VVVVTTGVLCVEQGVGAFVKIETVAKKRVEFVPTTANRLYEVEIT